MKEKAAMISALPKAEKQKTNIMKTIPALPGV
jgi:hypothetical protein